MDFRKRGVVLENLCHKDTKPRSSCWISILVLPVLWAVWYNARNMTQSRRVVKHIVWCHFERSLALLRADESRNLFFNRFPFVSPLRFDESASGGQIGIKVEMTGRKQYFF